jgi:hypothetical protein
MALSSKSVQKALFLRPPDEPATFGGGIAMFLARFRGLGQG